MGRYFLKIIVPNYLPSPDSKLDYPEKKKEWQLK